MPDLASRALALCQASSSADWQAAYGHPVLDRRRFRGRATLSRHRLQGQRLARLWRHRQVYAWVSEDFNVAHNRPRTLYVSELVRHAARTLRRRTLPPPLATTLPTAAPTVSSLPAETLASLAQW